MNKKIKEFYKKDKELNQDIAEFVDNCTYVDMEDKRDALRYTIEELKGYIKKSEQD